MKRIDGKDNTTIETAIPPRIGVGSGIIFALLMLLLVATGVIIYFGWTVGDELPASSYIAMALGVNFSLAIGFGLMALIFAAAEGI